MMPPKISIIVPIYNSETTLDRCLNSIKKQTFNDFEVLLVDDGSLDNSLSICNNFADEDSRFRVFHKKNGGVASARQLGLDNAKGIYSIHCDSDDWIDPTMLADMYAAITAEDADMLIVDYFKEEIKQNVEYCVQNFDDNACSKVMLDILHGKLFGALWNKLIRHDLYSRYNVRFVEGINFAEDCLLLCKLLNNDIKIVYKNKAYYHYVMQENSLTHTFSQETYQTRKKVIQCLENIIPDNLPISKKDYINAEAYNLKIQAFRKGFLSAKEFYSFKRTSLNTYFRNWGYGWRIQVCMLLACVGLFPIARLCGKYMLK